MKRTDELSSLEDIFGPVIMSYTRAQALEDGVLVDAGPLAREAGFHWPVALTRAVWEDCVSLDGGRQPPPGLSGSDWTPVGCAVYGRNDHSRQQGRGINCPDPASRAQGRAQQPLQRSDLKNAGRPR